MGSGYQGPTDGRALLTCLNRHLPDHLGYKQAELGGSRFGRWPEEGGVQGIGLGVESDRPVDNPGMGSEESCGGGRSGEANRVLSVEVVEQVPDAATDQLESAVREDAGVDDQTHHGLGQERRGGGRLDDGGQAGQERRGQLLQGSPAREVEGVDLNGDAPTGGGHVGGQEGAIPGQDLRFTL